MRRHQFNDFQQFDDRFGGRHGGGRGCGRDAGRTGGFPEGPEEGPGPQAFGRGGPRGRGRGGFGPGFPGGPAGFGPGFGPGGPGFGPGGRGPRGPRGRGRGRRGVQRGDVRVAVLQLLAASPMHGYQIVQAVEERTGGAWRPSPGAIYPTLSQLEDEGLITIAQEQGRKVATLTDAGRAYLESEAAGIDPFAAFEAQRGEQADLRSTVQELVEVTRRVARNGDATQIAEVDKILGDAVRQVYLLLATADRGPRPAESAEPDVDPEDGGAAAEAE
ncbi:PadR family transcriptional regulator [Tsukamurella soli]|uniref:Transcription regulator PadR N-terminal domain-containing protein n=1 Tax=Tsukamurella soli TaxID=644556 RepID=A0ABP8JHI1_9ACTN